MTLTRATMKRSRSSMKQPGTPAFRVDNWLATCVCPCRKAAKTKACVVHPLLALAMAIFAGLAVLVVAQIGPLERLRAWGRMAAPPPTLHAAMSRLSGDELSNLRVTLPLKGIRRL